MRLRRNGTESELARFWLFSECSRKELLAISRMGTRIKIAADRHIVSEGRRDTDVIIVLSGMANCELRGEVIAHFGEGDFFGEISALDGGRRTATVVAASQMEVLVLDQSEFELLLATSHSVATRILHVSASRLRSANASVMARPVISSSRS